MDLAADVKKIISSIIPRGDHQLQQKVFNVNKELKELCASKNITYIEHDNIHLRNHLNRSKLHFNFHGNTLFLSNVCKYCVDKFLICCNEKEGNVNAKINNCNRKDIESSSNNLGNCDVTNKNNIENTNSKNSEFCIDKDITNKADINKVMDEESCKIHQESEESKSRDFSYSSEDFSSLLRHF